MGRVVLVDDRPRPGPVAPSLARLVELVRVPGPRHGKGGAVAAGISAARRAGPRAAVLVIDADGQHPPESIPAFLAAAGRADLVIGDRLGDRGAMPIERRLSNLVARALLGWTAGRRVGDTQCGMRLVAGRALEVEWPRGGYEAETAHLKRCLRRDIAVGWVPIPAIYDGEPSGFRPVRDAIRILATIVR